MLFIFFIALVFRIEAVEGTVNTLQVRDFWLSRFYNGTTLSRTAATGVVPLQFKENAKTPKTLIYPVLYIRL